MCIRTKNNLTLWWIFRILQVQNIYLLVILQVSKIYTWGIESTGFPGGSAGKESACNAGDLGSVPGLVRSHGEGNSYSLWYFDLENSMDCIVRGITKSLMQPSDFHFHRMLASSLGPGFCCSVPESCLTLCDPIDCSPPGSSVHDISQEKNTRVGCHFLLWGIFLTQELNPPLPCLLHLLYWQVDPLPLSP